MNIMPRFLLLVCFVAMAIGQQEPCQNYVNITDNGRSIRYTAHATEPNICDRNINESVWYRFQVTPPQRIHDQCVEGLKCGTDQPIWLRGNHPTAADPGPKEVDVCSPLGDDCCAAWNSTISVKFCPATTADDDDYYVYRLKRVPQCDMAYCAGDGNVCRKRTVWNPNSQSCTAQIGAFECSSDSECHLHVNNTFCSSDGLCLCDAAFHPDSSRTTCISNEFDSLGNSSLMCQASITNIICLCLSVCLFVCLSALREVADFK